MKRIDEMTPDELMVLAEDLNLLERTVDYECALEGVPLLPPEPVVPDPPEGVADLNYWRVSFEVHLAEKEQALALCEVVDQWRSRAMRTQSVGGPYSYGGPWTPVPVEQDAPLASPAPTKLWSAQHYAEHKASQEAYASEKSEYDRDKALYDKAAKDRHNVERFVRNAVEDVASERHEKVRAAEEFKRYVPLANGDKEVALAFYLKAHQDQDEKWTREAVGLSTVGMSLSPHPKVEAGG